MINNVYGKFLPLGSVVLLKGGKKRLMITGYSMTSKDDEKHLVYDYTGCLYPEGVIKADKIAVFNHDQIEKIFCLGFRDQECVDFLKKLDNFLEKQKSLAVNSSVDSIGTQFFNQQQVLQNNNM